MTEDAAEAPDRAARLWWIPLALAAAPLVLGLAVLAQSTWYPIGDLGQANLRMLSFWGHPPLVGAAGRIVGPGGVQGNHPGPAQFWVTWPIWAVLGRSSWALNGAVALSNLAGGVVAVLCARRVGGRSAAAAVGALVVVLIGGFGPEVMLQPWNPSMPLLWFLVLVIATWGAVAGHRGLLPVVAGAACYVVQCHAGYAPVALGLCGLAGLGIGWSAWRAEDRRRALWGALPWLAGAGATAAVLWIPPLIDQTTHDPGNIDILRYSFSHPDEDYVGLASALRVLLLQLDPSGPWLRGVERMDGLPIAGALLLVAWIGTGVAARRHLPALWAQLDLVLAATLLGAWVSISRIFGLPFVYLFKWTWVLTALVVLATAAHIWAWTSERNLLRGRLDTRRVVLGCVAVATAVGLVVGAARFGRAEISGERYSDTIAGVIEPTSEALDPDQTYLVVWRDPVALGGMGFGMVLELERRGFDVGVPQQFSAAAEPHRVLAEADSDRVINVVTGQEAINAALALPGAVMVAQTDPRSAEERARYAALAERAAARLQATGFDEQAAALREGGNLFGILLSAELPADVVDDITELVGLSLPTAVVLSDPVGG